MFDRVSASGYGAASALWSLAYDGGLGLGAAGFGLLAAATSYPGAFAVTAALRIASDSRCVVRLALRYSSAAAISEKTWLASRHASLSKSSARRTGVSARENEPPVDCASRRGEIASAFDARRVPLPV